MKKMKHNDVIKQVDGSWGGARSGHWRAVVWAVLSEEATSELRTTKRSGVASFMAVEKTGTA